MLEQENKLNDNKSRKLIWIIVILLVIIAGTLIYYFVFFERGDFTKEQESELVLASGEFYDSGGRLANNLINFFEDNDLKTSMKVCEGEVVLRENECYRLLAIVKEENKKEICREIGDVEQKRTCEMRIPFLM